MYNMATVSVTLPAEMLSELLEISINSHTPINDLIYHAVKSLIKNTNNPPSISDMVSRNELPEFLKNMKFKERGPKL